MASATSFYDFKPLDKRGSPYPTADLNNKVVLLVNTASKCGFTPQLTDLQTLYKTIKASPRGSDFEMLGFPCNQFGNQSPEDNPESFCQLNYGVEFPILAKTEVNGGNAEPLWKWLTKTKPGIMGIERVKWNFEKFLVGRDGRIKGRWASTKKPLTLQADIEKALEEAGAEGVTPTTPKTPAAVGGEKAQQATPAAEGTEKAQQAPEDGVSDQKGKIDVAAPAPGQEGTASAQVDGATAAKSPAQANEAEDAPAAVVGSPSATATSTATKETADDAATTGLEKSLQDTSIGGTEAPKN